MSYSSANEESWYAGVPRSTRNATIFGSLLILFTVVGFGVWGNTAPIAGAVVTSGVFVATGQNKIIQHLEGGVIKEIHVREGDVVEAGQTLVDLDEVAPRAELRRLDLRRVRLEAVELRLQAEMRELPEISFPDHLATATEPEFKEILANQRFTFEARMNTVKSEIASIEDGIRALQERIEGSNVQLVSVRRQLKLVEEEIELQDPAS